MGPMFPRLHVNDTDKGPRAPPRNKMALYEQLSIPSQQFSSRVSPFTGSPAPTSQGTGYDKISVNLSSSTNTDQAKKLHSHPYRAEINSSLLRTKQGKKLEDYDDDEDDDFRSILLKPRTGQYKMGIGKKFNEDETYTTHVTNLRSDLSSRNELESNDDHQSMVQFAKPSTKVSGTLSNSQVYMRKSSIGRSQSDYRECISDVAESPRALEECTSPLHRSDSFGYNRDGSADGDDISEHLVDKTCSSLSIGNEDESDTFSETSMVDSISALNVTPDDVVGMIGRKHFWRARRAIMNQQRVFAIQLFELHRLIKVQQLIAGSTELIAKCTLLGNSTLKGTQAKKLPSQYVVTPQDCIKKCKVNSDKMNKRERSAENIIGKAQLCAKPDNQPSTRGPDLGNLQATSLATGVKMGSFHHPTVRQWLFPIMSSSEGLIYKPCPETVFLGQVAGGFGPYRAMPLSNHHVGPAYGIPAHHQRIGVVPAAPPPSFGHTNFPPYGMRITNQPISGSSIYQSNLFAGHLNCQNTQISGGAATANHSYQKSRKVPTEGHKAISSVVNSQASKEEELGANMASISEQSRTESRNHASERRREVLPNFPVALVAMDCHQPHGNDQPTRPIRVIPRNGRSANESVARIFRSIQKERKENDSV